MGTETVVPLKVVEAMACRKAIIASRVGGLMEVLTPSEDCLAIDPGDTRGLAESIVELAAAPDRRARLGGAAFDKAAQWPSWDDSAGRLMDFYHTVASP